MKKILNDPRSFVDEVMDGILAAYGDRLEGYNGDPRVLVSRSRKRDGRVGVITGGGSGHLPVFLGYVGEGMLDGCAVGNVFASPSAKRMAETIRACDNGAGVLCLFGNYSGDGLNFDMACEDVDFDDIKTRIVKVRDDVASSPRETAELRRGVAGMVYAFKIAGAAAAELRSLDEVAAAAEKALANTRSMGVALAPCVIPEVGTPSFTIADDEMEWGMGIHGEPGVERSKLADADTVADRVLDTILKDMPLSRGDTVSVMVNGLGATSQEELFIVYRRLSQRFSALGVEVFMPHVGEFATSMEMAGLSVSVIKLDDELKALLRAPASTPFYTNHNK